MSVELPTAEEKELSIDSIDGLHEFLLYAKEALNELEESSHKCTSKQLCLPFIDEGRNTFRDLESLIIQYTRILDLGGYLEDEHIESMQRLYNGLLNLQDELTAAMEYVPSTQDHTEKHIYGEVQTNLSSPKKQATMSVESDPEDVEVSLAIKENAFNSEEIRSNLRAVQRRGEICIKEAETILEEYKDIRQADGEDYSEGLRLYTLCENNLAELLKQLTKLEAVIALPVSISTIKFLEETEKFVSDFTSLVKEAAKDLPEYFADELPTIEADVSVTSKPSSNHEQAFRPSLFAKNELRPFIEGALKVPNTTEFLAQYFSSPGAFEAHLKRDIDEREKPSKFEKVFGIKHQSPFHTLLRDLTLSEVEHLEHLPSVEIREILQELDIQYEIYVAWMNAYEVMKDYVRVFPNTTFGGFYVRAMIEELKSK